MKNIFFFTLFIFNLVSIASAGDLLSKSEFSNRYVSVVIKMNPEAKAEVVNELEVRITLPDNTDLTSFLDNAYIDYKNKPEEIDSLLVTYVESLTLSKDFEKERFGKERIFPVIKDRLYIKQVEEMFKKSGKKGLVYEKINDVLYVLYAFDTPKSIRFITEDDLSDVGVRKSDLRQLSKSNLKKSIPNLKLEGDPSALSMLVADGTYEASFILYDGIWTKEQFPVKGNIVVYIPTRDLVLITGSEDKENLAKIHDIVYSQENHWSHIVAEVGFVRVDSGWQEFRP